MGKPIRLFYWNTGNVNNFGDTINAFIVETLTGKPVQRVGLECKKNFYMAAGSIVHLATPKTSIWGSGLIADNKMFKEPPRAIRAVRGPITRSRIISAGHYCPEVYGDPALLLPKIHSPQVEKKYNIGILPHYIDKEHQWVSDAHKRGYRVIDITNPDPVIVLHNILECNTLITSSLHGLIVADAYDIPSVWATFSNNLMGGQFKFHDYFLSVHKPRKLLNLRNSSTARLSEVTDYITDRGIEFDAEALINVCPMLKG